jgi:hypothetical protein
LDANSVTALEAQLPIPAFAVRHIVFVFKSDWLAPTIQRGVQVATGTLFEAGVQIWIKEIADNT